MGIAIMQTRKSIPKMVSSRDNINPELINARTSDFKAQPSRYPDVVSSLFGWLWFCFFAPVEMALPPFSPVASVSMTLSPSGVGGMVATKSECFRARRLSSMEAQRSQNDLGQWRADSLGECKKNLYTKILQSPGIFQLSGP